MNDWNDIKDMKEALERVNPYPEPGIKPIKLYPNVRRLVRERFDPFIFYDELEFVKQYSLTKKTAQFVANLLREELTPEVNNPLNVSVEISLLVALRYYSQGYYQHKNCDLHGLSQPTVSRCIAKVSVALAEKADLFIAIPENLDNVKQSFFEIAGCPEVIGCVDCTHIKIKLPSNEDAASWCNTKGWYSIKVQIVCDSSGKMLDLVAKSQGSTRDSRIWDNCGLKKELSVGNLQGKGVILGDSAYPCKSYLLTPVNYPETPEEIKYNKAHNKTRECVGQTFTHWKAMFHSLESGLLLKLETAKAAIVAMAVIYNIRKEHDGYDFNNFLQTNDGTRPEDEEDGSESPLSGIPLQNCFIYREHYIENNFS